MTCNQEGRNYARLRGHGASWTGHYTAQLRTLPRGTQPCNYNCISRCNLPWTSTRSTALNSSTPSLAADRTPLHFTVSRVSCGTSSPWQTRRLCATQQPCFPTATNTAGEGPVTYSSNLGDSATTYITSHCMT